jgi:hypothetical protein
MKKIVTLLVLLAVACSFVMADDALTLPAKVIRVYATGALATVKQEYDGSGKAQDKLPGNITAINVGAAVEYGVTDWISAAVQWAPGYNVYSKVDATGYDKANLADAADLFVGAKFQIVGPQAPVKNDMFRFAVAPGVKFPLGTVDWKKQYENYTGGDDFLLSAADKHTFGAGGRVYFDYVINEMFFLNLYSEFIYYPMAVDIIDTGLKGYGTVSSVQGGDPTYNPTVKYGYDLTLEFEPHFGTMIGDGLKLSAGVPFTYTMEPKTEVSGDTYSLVGFATTPAESLLTIGPNASLFFQKAALPFEVKVGYTLPLMGENSNATNTLVLQLKAYAKF